MFNSEFKIVYFILYLIIVIVRKVYTAKYRTLDTVLDKKTKLDLVLLGLNGVAMLLPLVYVFSTALDFANYKLPDWLGWTGAGLFGVAILLLWRSHADLGRNWTVTIGLRDEHTLITKGIFKYIRHPMYAAHILWAIAQIMILHNWLVAYPFFLTITLLYLIRVKSEEEMMVEKFGEEYKQYMVRTGRILPKSVSKTRLKTKA
jgi:protein-S-isoprenylcysteine O-methyltransferase Ste14